ncbi:hypothetical protein ACFPFV_12410 [Salinicoccus siamensis]|uniref:hypothetical protein n=1 Tax=Salinicoccus siamensis TaxID=381830 RepID=UPI0036149BD3
MSFTPFVAAMLALGNHFFHYISVKYTAQVSTVWKKVSGKHLQHLTFQRKTGG